MLTVIIPAWKCADTIHRALLSLARQEAPPSQTVQVIVAVNDGDPQSVAAAERYRSDIEANGMAFSVIETAPGRRSAFKGAEAMAAPGARLFVDQDAALSKGALRAFVAATEDPEVAKFITFQLRFTRSPSFFVRHFIAVWTALPYFAASPVVAGVFGVSHAGRMRWIALPEVSSDDKFVRLLFAPHERERIVTQAYEVVAPTTYCDLVKARARYARGNRQLARLNRAASRPDASRYAGWSAFMHRPASALVFVLTMLFAALLSYTLK